MRWELGEQTEIVKSMAEVAAVALVYTAAGLSLGVMRVVPPTAVKLTAVLLLNLSSVGAASWYVTHTIGHKWVAAFGTASMLTVAQLLLPRLELALKARSGLEGMLLLAGLGELAALFAAAGLVLAFGPQEAYPGAEPAVSLPLPPREYLWRLPLLVTLYALLHTLAATAATHVTANTAGPAFGDMVMAYAVCGWIWVGALVVCTLNLEARLAVVVRALISFVVVGGMAGRLLLRLSSPLAAWVGGAVFPAVADLVAGFAAGFLLLPPLLPLEDEKYLSELD